jgi:DNA-binding transcriptional MerR regulator
LVKSKTAREGRGAEGKYSISLAANLVSIPPDTLRVWERRYGVPKPARTPGGGRLYSDADIALLRLVSRGIDRGYRPQELLGRSRAEIEELLRAVDSPASVEGGQLGIGAPAPAVSSALEAARTDDVDHLRREIRRAALVLGPRAFVVDYCDPLLVRTGELWAQGKLAVRQEHVVSDALATQLRVLLATYEDLARGPVVVLTTLPGELHSLGILMVALYSATQGAAPRMLGPSTPVPDTCEAARVLRAEVVGIGVTRAADLRATDRQLRELRTGLPRRVRLWVGGDGARDLATSEGIERVASWSELDRALGTRA